MSHAHVVTPRDEHDGADRRHLVAYLDDEGPGESIIAVLSRKYTDRRSYGLERILRESDIPQRLRVWSG